MNYEHIMRTLTLRYDPKGKPGLKPLKSGDFTPKNASGIEQKILGIVQQTLLEEKDSLKKISVSLSAGVDSGFNLAMMRKFLPDSQIHCFSMGFGDADDEVGVAKEIARFYGCDFHEIIKEDVLEGLPKLISIAGEPRWNLYQFYPLSEGRKKSGVFYSGDGADELFGGYVFRYKKFLSLLRSNSGWKQKAKTYLSCHERDWVPDQGKLFGTKLKFSWQKIYSILRPYFDNRLAPIDQVFLADFNGKLLYDWVPTNKAFGKFLGLDIRSLFLTNNMIKFATHVPWKMKYDAKTGVGKLPLRSILAKEVPFQKTKPVKKGFGMDIGSLWDRGAKEVVSRYVNSESEVVKGKIISGRWIANSQEKLGARPDPRYVNKMLAILALEVWYRIFVSKTMKGNEKL